MSSSLRAAALAVAMLALITGCQAGSGVTVHSDDDQHPMALYAGSGGFASSAEQRAPDGTWTTTFGSNFPCIANGPGPIVIDGVDWISDDGLDPLSVRVYLRTFDDSEFDPIASMVGTPLDNNYKDWSGTTQEGVEGFKVERSCTENMDGKGQTDEMLVAVTADEGGGHVGDFTVRYTTPDGRRYAVVSDWQMHICGTEASKDLCDGNPET
ncbi:hypothetical protein AB1046_10655 [Promicromonospora sp. Populi]|uniref:hypothetical protein n=1 Tax=Promicromonospora sp. Populi TaxID=3239420 RepID=UPI0034E1A63C